MSQEPDTLPIELSPAAELYVWGFPLVSVHRTRLLFCSRSKTGQLNHVNDLATPSDRGVVAPNNDTLYSSGWYDLRHGDLTLDVPPMDHPGRYWNVMILDAYTHVAYVCRRHHGVGGTQVRVTFDPDLPPSNDGSRLVTLATPTAWVIVRVLVETPEEIETARKLQRAITVTAAEAQPIELTTRAGRPTAISQAGVDYFTELKRYAELDPPGHWHPPLSDAARAILDNPALVPEEVLLNGVTEGDKLISGMNTRGNVVKNGWSTGRNATGFGGDILKRAVGARFGLGGHQAIENRSYIAVSNASGDKLHGSQTLRLRMEADALPPCDAFWSLTAYGTDLYLVENEIDRWSIGDRTPDLTYGPDGSLTITLSHLPPKTTANWLPVPAGPYLLGLRVYEGHNEVVDCEWFPPALVAP